MKMGYTCCACRQASSSAGLSCRRRPCRNEGAGAPRDHVGTATFTSSQACRGVAMRMVHESHGIPLRWQGLTFLNQRMLFFCAAIQTQDLVPLLAARRCPQANRTGTRRRQLGNTWDKQSASFPRGEYAPTNCGCSPHVQAQVCSEPAGS
jgi:hypothetical protein